MQKHSAHLNPAQERSYTPAFRGVSQAVTQGDTMDVARSMPGNAPATPIKFYFEPGHGLPQARPKAASASKGQREPRMRREDAKPQVLKLWRQWSNALGAVGAVPPEGKAVHLFWAYLKARHPHVVDFASLDHYGEIKQWLAEDAQPD